MYSSMLRAVLLFFIHFYRVFLSGILGGNCRFYPSCSSYAQTALKKHSSIKATYLIFLRICRCHPFSCCGYDPVPELKLKEDSYAK